MRDNSSANSASSHHHSPPHPINTHKSRAHVFFWIAIAAAAAVINGTAGYRNPPNTCVTWRPIGIEADDVSKCGED